MASELHSTHDDSETQRQETPSSLGSRLRTVAMWSLVFLVAVVAAFGTGYFLQEREVLDLRQQLVEQKANTASEVLALERRVLAAEKTQLEHELERANMNSTLNRVLAPLPVALAEVERKNFGNAMERIMAARYALQSPGINAAVREVATAKLDAIVAEMTAEIGLLQQAGFRERIAVSAQALEQVLVARHDVTPFFAPRAAGVTEGPAVRTTPQVLTDTASAPTWYAAPPSFAGALGAAPVPEKGARSEESFGPPVTPEVSDTPEAIDVESTGAVDSMIEEAHAASDSEVGSEAEAKPVTVESVKTGPFWWMTSKSAPVESVEADPGDVPSSDSIGVAETGGRYRWSWEVDDEAEADEVAAEPAPRPAADPLDFMSSAVMDSADAPAIDLMAPEIAGHHGLFEVEAAAEGSAPDALDGDDVEADEVAAEPAPRADPLDFMSSAVMDSADAPAIDLMAPEIAGHDGLFEVEAAAEGSAPDALDGDDVGPPLAPAEPPTGPR